MLEGKTILLGVTRKHRRVQDRSAWPACSLKQQRATVHVLMTTKRHQFHQSHHLRDIDRAHKCLVDTFDRNFELQRGACGAGDRGRTW